MSSRHVLVEDSDSDDPIVLDAPPSLALRSRSRSASSQPLAERRAEAQGGSRPRKRGRRPQPEEPKSPGEEDDIVFVRENKARELASRFTFQPDAPRSRRLGPTSSTTTAPTPAASFASGSSSSSSLIATPFNPILATPREPLPVPDWLPRTAILKELPKCVLCQREFKKSESGAARWVSALRRIVLTSASSLDLLSSGVPAAKLPAGSGEPHLDGTGGANRGQHTTSAAHQCGGGG